MIEPRNNNKVVEVPLRVKNTMNLPHIPSLDPNELFNDEPTFKDMSPERQTAEKPKQFPPKAQNNNSMTLA
jgi:hypothetical protein